MDSNPFSLNKKTVLITGASSGIGKATAIECSKMGATVIITGRNEKRLKETFDSLHGKGHSSMITDLTDSRQLSDLVDSLPILDGCFNNAGITKMVPVSFINKDLLDSVLAVNTIAPILLVQQIVKKKKIAKGGSIVFCSSVSGVYCSAVASSLYSTTKGAINGFVKGAALDLAPKQIRVNTVNPGMVETEIFTQGNVTQEQLEIDKLRYPLARYGKPEEVAYAVIYLFSDASKWITGSNLLIDGGYTLL